MLAHVWGFRPYFYVAAPSGFLNEDLSGLKDVINVSSGVCFQTELVDARAQSSVQIGVPAVSKCIIVHKKSLWGYRGDDEVPFIKIVCTEPKALPKVKDKSLAAASDVGADQPCTSV